MASNRTSTSPASRRKPTSPQAFLPLFRALGDATRLEIVQLIAGSTTGELCVCEMESRFDLAQPTISHHLRLLREAGLVKAERRGTWVYYTLDEGTLESISAFAPLLLAAAHKQRTGKARRRGGARRSS